MNRPPSVLVFTYAEHGQANVNLAIAYELALVGVNVYIASFASLKDRVSRLQELVVRHASCSSTVPRGSIIFQECKGFTSYAEAAGNRGLDSDNVRHPHGVSGVLECYSKLDTILTPWSPVEYLGAINSCKAIIADIKPNLVVVDVLFYSAQDACRLVDQKFMIMTPNAIREIALSAQPYLASLWKYPATGSGFPFPLKWWQVPLNIYLNIRLIIQIVTGVRFKQLEALRESLGLTSMFSQPIREVTYICPAVPQTDFPYTIIPKQIHLCGPIVMPFDPLEESDPILMKWLENGPTVMINLGSHVRSDAEYAKEMASSIRVLLDYHDQKHPSDMQVLWKVKANGDVETVINEIIGKEIGEGRVKLLAWLDAEPVSILQHPNLICTVHHGGANSFFEGILSGLPHIVLPVWSDTYDFATRVEFLNIGVFGSKTSAPRIRKEELGKVLIRVTGDGEEARKLRTAAKCLKDVCRAKGKGRELAARVILEEIDRLKGL